MNERDYAVRAVHCHHEATEEKTYQALVRATAPLTRAWEKLEKASRIGIKINQDKHPDRFVYHRGMLQQLVCDKVVRATLRLLRERTTAEIVCTDVSFYAMYENADPLASGTATQALEDYGVEYVIGHQAPTKVYDVPGGGQMFARYVLPEPAVECDEFISLAKMKNHGFMGITLTLKNLFGLMPVSPAAIPALTFTTWCVCPTCSPTSAAFFIPASTSSMASSVRLGKSGEMASTRGRQWRPTPSSPATTLSPPTPAVPTSWATIPRATG
jgi:hypothetical protein